MNFTDMLKNVICDEIDPKINERNFPIAKRNRNEYELELEWRFYSRTTEQVLRNLAAEGLEPADIADLIEFGSSYHRDHDCYYMVALGSVCKGWVTYIDTCNGGVRKFGICGYEVEWNEPVKWSENHRFLVRRKKT